jgi:DNA-binding MarR family transcriptional regulator
LLQVIEPRTISAVSERAAVSRERYGVPSCVQGRDRVDDLLVEWAQQRPDLDFTPVGVITRLARVRGYLDAELAGLFARFDLTQADFLVVITLRRSGGSYTMPQARLMEALGLTSGTVSVRLDRLERRGIVSRSADPANARVSLVRLTDKGIALFDEVAPLHLANEDRLLSALTDEQRLTLADLLRRLLGSFEAATTDVAADLGLTLEPAHRARTRRLAVGLSDTAGLLVVRVAPGSPAARAGIERGDLVTRVAGFPATSGVDLALLLADRADQHRLPVDLLRGNDALTVLIRRPD